MYYVRKLSKPTSLNKIRDMKDVLLMEADVLKQELATSGNTLSFWKSKSLDDKDLHEAMKAILLSGTEIVTSQFIIFDNTLAQRYDFIMDASELGITGYKGREALHINMTALTYGKIGRLLEMLRDEVVNNAVLTPKKQKSEVIEMISEVVQAGILNESEKALNPHLKKDIEKYCK